MEMAQSMLNEMHLPKTLWAEAIAAAVHVLNRTPTSVVEHNTPYEALKGEKPTVGHLWVFGCVAHVIIDSHFRQKLDSKTDKYIFIGYCEKSKAYKLYDPNTEKLKINRNVKFFEDTPWSWSKSSKSTSDFVSVNTQGINLEEKQVEILANKHKHINI